MDDHRGLTSSGGNGARLHPGFERTRTPDLENSRLIVLGHRAAWTAIPSSSSSGGDQPAVLPTGWTKIANVTTGMTVDGGGGVSSGTALKQWAYNGSTNLQWQFVSLGNGYYRIVNNTDGLVIDSNGNTTSGAAPLETTWANTDNQQWSLTDLGNGDYQIVNRGTGLCLDGGGLTTNGSPMKMWPVGSSTDLERTITTA